MARQESIHILTNILNNLSSPPSSYPPPHQNPSLQSYYQQGSLTLLSHLIAEIEFSLSSISTTQSLSTVASSNVAAAVSQPPPPATVATVKEMKSTTSTSTPLPLQQTTMTTEGTNLTINSLDIRVGKIVKVSPHESANKLYCEEIDVGEEIPRPIASGLVPYYTLEEMENRRVLVLCNLKPRSLVGFKSNGMVLCASTTDENGNHKVEFIDPPSDAAIGSRIIGKDLELIEPLNVKQCDKQKAFQILATDLKVNEEGVVVWKDHPLVTIEGKSCTAPTLRNCPVA